MRKGFTLIELLIVIAIIGIVAAIVAGQVNGNRTGAGSMGINGYVETRCIDGLKFTVGRDGVPRQVLSELGKGVPCTNAIPHSGAALPQ